MREPKEESGQATCPSTQFEENNFGCFGSAHQPHLQRIANQRTAEEHSPSSSNFQALVWAMANGSGMTTFTGALTEQNPEDLAPNLLFPLGGLRRSQLQAKSRQKSAHKNLPNFCCGTFFTLTFSRPWLGDLRFERHGC